MPKMKAITIDAKTGEVTYHEEEIPKFPEDKNEPKGLDLEKVKDVLMAKGLIKDKSEVE